MTSPLQPIILQQPGPLAGLNEGLGALIQGLQFRKQQQMEQQKVDLQKQEQERLALQQRTTERNQNMGRVLDLMNAMGPEVLDDPSVQQKVAEFGLDPKAILKKYQVGVKQQEAQQQADFDMWVQTLPDFLRPGQVAAFNAVKRGLAGKDQAATLAAAVNAQQIKPETLAIIDREMPELRDLPIPLKLEKYAEFMVARAQIRLGIGPEAKRDVDLKLVQARTELVSMQRRMLAATDPKDKLPIVREFLRQIDLQLSDPVLLATRDLYGKSLEDKVTALFGASSWAAYQNALKFLEKGIPESQP